MLRLFIYKKTNPICKQNLSDLPSGEQMNQCVPLAHYLACSAKQHTSGLRQRIKHGPGSRPFPSLSSHREDAHVDWANVVDDEPAVGRVSGDSDCSGPTNLPLSLSACSGSPLTQMGSYLWLNHQRAASFHRLPSDRRLSQL